MAKSGILIGLALSTSLAAELPETRIAQTATANELVDPLKGPHLFLDDYLIAASENVSKRVHSPIRVLNNPVITYQDRVHQPFVTVVRDPETKRFRMWYDYFLPAAQSGIQKIDTGLAYAESKDGISWDKPVLNIIGADNRTFRQLRGKEHGSYGGTVIDEGPAFGNKAERFKTAWFSGIYNPTPGLQVAYSADGLHWTPYSESPVLPYYEPEDPKWAFGVQDVVDIFWDPLRRHYSLFHKIAASPADGYQVHGTKAGPIIRRLVGQSKSKDLVHWSVPWRVAVPAKSDNEGIEFYSIGGTFARGGLLIGFARVLQDNEPAEPSGSIDGIGWSALVTSRDGITWERHPERFLDRNAEPDTWDRAMAWISTVVPVDDDLYLYYGGYKRGHKIEPRKERQIGLARMKQDRFVSRNNGQTGVGRLKTVQFRNNLTPTSRLHVNATIASGGHVKVQIRDKSDQVIKGLSFSDIALVTGDGLSLPVRAKQGEPLDLTKAGSTFSVEFELVDAQLFGLSFTP